MGMLGIGWMERSLGMECGSAKKALGDFSCCVA